MVRHTVNHWRVAPARTYRRLMRISDVVRLKGGDVITVRSDAAVTELLAGLPDSAAAVIVSHGGTIRVLAALLLGLDSLSTARLLTTPGNCQWADLVEGPDGWRIAGWNLRA